MTKRNDFYGYLDKIHGNADGDVLKAMPLRPTLKHKRNTSLSLTHGQSLPRHRISPGLENQKINHGRRGMDYPAPRIRLRPKRAKSTGLGWRIPLKWPQPAFEAP